MNYVQEIADKFLEKCHNAVTLGPADFTLIAEWEKEGIPKEVVLNAIAALCTPGVNSVADITIGVKQFFVDWLQRESSFNSAGC
jgi:hypothetical protein